MTASEIIVIVGQFLLSLSLLIVLHELGHFVPAKLFKTKVEKFYLFFDVKFSLFKKKIGETVYGIGWLPLGGYVKIAGMIDESMDTAQLAEEPQPWEFRSKPAWQRLIIMLGGVFVNFVLAWSIYIGMSFVWGEKYLAAEDIGDSMRVSELVTENVGLQTGDKILSIDGEGFDTFGEMRENFLFAKEVKVVRDGKEQILTVPQDFLEKIIDDNTGNIIGLRLPLVVGAFDDDSPNKGKELKKGDVLLRLGETEVKYFEDASEELKNYKGQQVNAKVFRNGKEQDIQLQVNDQGKLGIITGGISMEDMGKLGYLKLSTKEYSFGESFGAGTARFLDRFASFGKQLKALVTPSTGAYKGLGSFISIAKIFPTTWDWQAFWSITAFLSIMLGVLNLLPIPALDGGHAMFLVYELIAGKKPSDKFLEYAQMAGFIILISLFIFAFGNDIYRNFLK